MLPKASTPSSESSKLFMLSMCCLYTVYDVRVTSCPASHVADVTAVDSSSLGYVSNTLAPSHASCGRRSCPWVVRGVPGQRVQLSVTTHLTITILGQVTSTSFCELSQVKRSSNYRVITGQRVQLSVVMLGHLRHRGDCPSVIIAEPTGKDHVTERKTFNICSTVTRQRHLFTTSGHVLVAYTSTNRSGQGQDLGQDHDIARGRRFLLMYKSL